MTSDLVLDEVDSYSADDLVALGKLVYLTGLYGRKVLRVSATLPLGIAVNFYRAYQAGPGVAPQEPLSMHVKQQTSR